MVIVLYVCTAIPCELKVNSVGKEKTIRDDFSFRTNSIIDNGSRQEVTFFDMLV